jgi:hypothetical protein
LGISCSIILPENFTLGWYFSREWLPNNDDLIPDKKIISLEAQNKIFTT